METDSTLAVVYRLNNRERFVIAIKALSYQKCIARGYDLLLISPESTDYLPSKGNRLMVVAKIDNFYHIRIFDRPGNIILDLGKHEFFTNAALAQEIDTAFDKESIDSDTKNNLIGKITSSISNQMMARLNSIKRKLKQFNLDHDVHEVISETLIRGIKTIEKGEDIRTPLPWIRQTGYNIIREWSRKQKEQQEKSLSAPFLSEDYPDQASIQTEASTIEFEVQLMLMHKAFATLKPNEQALIKLYWIDKLKWKEIAQLLPHKKNKPIKEGTARRRGGRALQKLREKIKQWPTHSTA